MSAVIILVIVATSIGVAVDAGGRDFSHSRFAKSPLGWLVGCLILWIVFFPAYLLQRNRAPVKNTLAVPVPTSPACPSCHRGVQAGARFCPYCGSSYWQ